jgi:hypothetical protein
MTPQRENAPLCEPRQFDLGTASLPENDPLTERSARLVATHWTKYSTMNARMSSLEAIATGADIHSPIADVFEKFAVR